ncbi:MAG: hypothetical protein LBR76_03585 [Oscillospiraceae bacterium]|jgi:hypothetical protein|nr:hypothetical protein [Oscillospiraceae bacterium]
MDFGFRRTRQITREIELPAHDGVRFAPTPDRVSRFLRLARERNPANALPDRLCKIGMGLFCALAALSLLVWGAGFRNATLVLRTWFFLSLLLAVPVLAALYIRQAFGLASKLHKYHSPTLTLGADRVILEMRRRMVFRGKYSPTVRREFLYSRIVGLDYDRATKTLRLISAYAPGDTTLEITMFYDQAEQIVREIEKRSGVFIHPAMRGDDYADLRDLPGLRRERGLLRPMCVCALLFFLASLMTVLSIRGYNAKHPYTPYPATALSFLTGRFGIGDTVTLDGCDFTLNSAAQAGSDARGVCYQVLMDIRNGNGSDIRLRAGTPFKDSPTNVSFTGITDDGGTVPLEASRTPPGYVGVDMPLPSRLQAGKSAAVNFFVWVPGGVSRVNLIVNSDYWPPADILRDVVYTGGTVTVGGQERKSNEIRFTVDLSETEATGG